MDNFKNLSAEEKEYLAEILNQITTSGSSEALNELWAVDYYEKPVSILEFLTNDEYLGKSVKDAEGNLTIYDYWIDKLQKMFDPSEDNPIQEVALSGCIGSGKSTCAVIGMCYFLYKLLCLKSPASYYHLATNSTIALAFFNVTLNQCYGVGYAKLQNYCKASPWFLRHGKVIGRTNPTYIPDGIEIVAGSKNEHFIGRDIFCAMLDEIDFAKGQDAAIEKSALMKLYSSVKSRINSRFMRKGRVPGLLFLVSSKNNVYDFLETYINMNRDNPRLMIIDEPLWVVKASVGGYSGETFKVAVGNRYYPSKILTDKDDWKAISTVQRVIDVPVEHKEAFKLNLNLALADVAGIAIVSASKYFNIEKVLATYRSYLQNPFAQEEISLGFDDDSAVKDFIVESLLPKSNRGTQSYHIHWDTAKNGDRAGLSMTTSSDHVKVNRMVKGEMKEVIDVIHKIVFAVGIKAMPGEEIPFYKIREFIYWLRDIGFNLATITCDSFQCLPADTLIKTNNGDKRIVDLMPNDKVMAFEFKSCTLCYTPFTNLRQSGTVDRLYSITVSDGRTVECTGNHPILTDKGYLRADEISKQCNIVCLNEHGNPEVQGIQSIVVKKVSKLPVYDIEVPYYWNFTLANGIIVHNSVDTIQQFKLQGFNSYTLSVDRSKDPYTSLRNAVNEGRLIAPKISLLEAEYADVEDDPIKNKIDHTPNGCLTGETKLLTYRGYKSIKDLTEKDVLFSFYRDCIVSSKFRNLRITRHASTLHIITTNRGAILECTENHPVLTKTGYIEAQYLFVGCTLLTVNKNFDIESSEIVSHNTLMTSPVPVYDIEVPKYSNFILANGIIVHNSKDILDSIAANVYKAGSYEAPIVTSNTASNLLDINADDEEEDLTDWNLPPGTTIVKF